MNTEKGIYAAINAIMDEIGAIGKDKRNTQQNFQYRGIDDVMNALQPALVRHKVFVTPEVLDRHREERSTKTGTNLIYSVLTVRYTFYAEDGSNVSATVVGEGMDSGDKASNKAMSVAFKYACFQVFCIPTEEMKDPDSETPPESKPKETLWDVPWQEPARQPKEIKRTDPRQEHILKLIQGSAVSLSDVAGMVKTASDGKTNKVSELTNKQFDELCGVIQEMTGHAG